MGRWRWIAVGCLLWAPWACREAEKPTTGALKLAKRAPARAKDAPTKTPARPKPKPLQVPHLIVLGVAQDAGYPQANCRKGCCRRVWGRPELQRYATSLALVEPKARRRWLLEATPDFKHQLALLEALAPMASRQPLQGILLTHAHIGHYAGLVHLGREVMGAKGVPVYAMPRMRRFLRTNGPWSQLLKLRNIALRPLKDGKSVALSPQLKITPFAVPHRDEFSETVGFRVEGPRRRVLFIPDVDKWSRWKISIEALLKQVDVAYLDGTFFDGHELPGRNMAEIPHPSIAESMRRFGALPAATRAKIRFIHLNHTNPALRPSSAQHRQILKAGFRVARQGERVKL